jgi:hypothetical protein
MKAQTSFLQHARPHNKSRCRGRRLPVEDRRDGCFPTRPPWSLTQAGTTLAQRFAMLLGHFFAAATPLPPNTYPVLPTPSGPSPVETKGQPSGSEVGGAIDSFVRGLFGDLIYFSCTLSSCNGIIRARSRSTPARPYIARLRTWDLAERPQKNHLPTSYLVDRCILRSSFLTTAKQSCHKRHVSSSAASATSRVCRFASTCSSTTRSNCLRGAQALELSRQRELHRPFLEFDAKRLA